MADPIILPDDIIESRKKRCVEIGLIWNGRAFVNFIDKKKGCGPLPKSSLVSTSSNDHFMRFFCVGGPLLNPGSVCVPMSIIHAIRALCNPGGACLKFPPFDGSLLMSIFKFALSRLFGLVCLFVRTF